MNKKDVLRRGAQPLPRFDERIDVVMKKMSILRISVEELRKKLSFQISYNSLGYKLRKVQGCHEFEINEIEKIIEKEEKKLISSLG